MDEYNIAVKYLKGKYRQKLNAYTAEFSKKFYNANKAQQKKMLKSITDDDYKYAISVPEDAPEKDRLMDLLLKQYYYGIAAQKELKELCIAMNLIPQS